MHLGAGFIRRGPKHVAEKRLNRMNMRLHPARRWDEFASALRVFFGQCDKGGSRTALFCAWSNDFQEQGDLLVTDRPNSERTRLATGAEPPHNRASRDQRSCKIDVK